MRTRTKTRRLLPRNVIGEMAAKANSAIDSALYVGSQTMISRPRTEVGLVAAVTLGGIRDIAKAWRPLCAGCGLTLQLTGVFCHAAPVVTFKDHNGRSGHCELADLLVVVDVTEAGILVRRAALIQAKMARAAERVSLSGPSSRVQLDLYQNWHKFDFKEAAYGMSHVDFTKGGGGPDSGTIGVIDRRWKGQPVWTQHAARPTPAIVSNQPHLGEFIAEMVDGSRPGFGRLATPTLQTDWSKTVERLLDVTYQRAFHDKSTLGPTKASRGVRAVACLGFATMANPMGGIWGGTTIGPPYEFETREDTGQPSGISIVHIDIGPIQDS